MNDEETKAWEELEKRVAQAYRDMGARRVGHNVKVGGHQIDVYVELEGKDRSLHRIAVEAKDHERPVGIGIVSDFSDIVARLRRRGKIDEGVIVSGSGFSHEGREAGEEHGLRLLEPEDLDAMVDRAKKGKGWMPPPYTPPAPPDPDAMPEPGRLPPGSSVPHRRNALFTGRQDALKRLARGLLHEEAPSTLVTQTVAGMGGVGKTQLAVEFAYRYGRFFHGVHWLNA